MIAQMFVHRYPAPRRRPEAVPGTAAPDPFVTRGDLYVSVESDQWPRELTGSRQRITTGGTRR